MKKTLILSVFTLSFFAACTSDSSTNTQDTTEVMSQTNNENRSLADTLGNEQSHPSTQYTKGKELIASKDCMGCHKEYDRIVGPSYSEVAKKYEATEENISMLADKIIAGGKGNWGEVPMTAHPDLSKEDASEMVKYILSLK